MNEPAKPVELKFAKSMGRYFAVPNDEITADAIAFAELWRADMDERIAAAFLPPTTEDPMHENREQTGPKFNVGQTVFSLSDGMGTIVSIQPGGAVQVRVGENCNPSAYWAFFRPDGRRSSGEKYPVLFDRPQIIIAADKLDALTTPNPDAFWLVFGDGPPTMRHSTEQSARDEAARLSRNNRGQRFYVLKTIAVVETGTETWRDLSPKIADLFDDGVPF